MILIYSCPADALDLELSIHINDWLKSLGIASKWLVSCEDLGQVYWFDEEIEVSVISGEEFEDYYNKLKPDMLIVDGLPFGSKGECINVIKQVPTLWFSRRLRWDSYLAYLDLKLVDIKLTTILLEPVSDSQQSFIQNGKFFELTFPILDAGQLPASNALDDDARHWLLLPSLDENQIAQQGGYAMELIEKEQKIPHLLDVAEFDPFQLPLYHLVSKYQRVIGGCSYSAACLALQWIGKDLKMGFRWVDQCDSWDDQTGRLSCIRKRKWIKKDRTLDWENWVKQWINSGGKL